MTATKNPVKKARAKAWKAFSKYIRYRDCMLTCGTIGHGKCCTCGKVFTIERLQAGHFIPGRNNAILFDPRCVHAQCVGCNMYGGGQQPAYYEFMIKRYGRETIDELFRQANRSMKLTAQDYEDYAKKFQNWAYRIELNEVLPDDEALDFIGEIRARLCL
jgi:hypothetical protein